jgi:hypothetical protein
MALSHVNLLSVDGKSWAVNGIQVFHGFYGTRAYWFRFLSQCHYVTKDLWHYDTMVLWDYVTMVRNGSSIGDFLAMAMVGVLSTRNIQTATS